jgi:hypothetical protein
MLAVAAAVFAAVVLFAGGALMALHFSARSSDPQEVGSGPLSPAGADLPQPSVSSSPESSAAGDVVAISPSPRVKPSKTTPAPAKKTPSPTASATEFPVKTPTSGDGRCIQLPASGKNGAQVSAADCDGSDAQSWIFTKEGVLMATGTSKCLDIGGNEGADIKFRVQIWDCNLGLAQVWVREPDGTLFNSRSGRCLTILPTADGGPALGIVTCVATPNQRWQLPA